MNTKTAKLATGTNRNELLNNHYNHSQATKRHLYYARIMVAAQCKICHSDWMSHSFDGVCQDCLQYKEHKLHQQGRVYAKQY